MGGPQTPLRTAVQAHHPKLMELLLKSGADANAKDGKGVAALHLAAFDGKSDCVKLLLENGADANLQDQHGQTPLFFAPSRHVCELLIAYKADLNVRNAKHQAPVHLAANAGLDDAVLYFVEEEDGSIDIKDKN